MAMIPGLILLFLYVLGFHKLGRLPESGDPFSSLMDVPFMQPIIDYCGLLFGLMSIPSFLALIILTSGGFWMVKDGNGNTSVDKVSLGMMCAAAVLWILVFILEGRENAWIFG